MNKLTLSPERITSCTRDFGDGWHSRLEVSLWFAPDDWSAEQIKDAIALLLPHKEGPGDSFQTEGKVVHWGAHGAVVVCREMFTKD
jgi:hypothetical protein